MGYAYTPGLTIADYAVVRKVRRLPIPGEVLVQVGQPVEAHDVVAQTDLPGEVWPIDLAAKLGVAPGELTRILLKRPGEPVRRDEIVARTRGLWGWFRREYRAPTDGTLESASPVTGQIILRGPATPLRRLAYAQGTIVDVQPGEAATVEIRGSFIQGIFGLGGEAVGRLEMVASSSEDILDAAGIGEQHADKIIVGGSLVTAAAIRAAAQAGVKGIVTGGIDDADVRDVLGYELGVAITGDETLGVTIVVTEGFGRIPMAPRTFELLRNRAGCLASMSGATQIRAGVIRPEIVIPLVDAAPRAARPVQEAGSLRVGTRLRAIREPFFGRLGRCTALPAELAELPTEARVRVVAVELDDGRCVTLPRANVEIIND